MKKASETIELIIFMIGDIVCAVSTLDVQEILRSALGMTAIHRAPDCVLGVLNLRGEIVTVINLRRVFGFDDVESNNHPVIIVHFNGESIGLCVDDVDDVIAAETALIAPRPTNMEQQQGQYMSGVLNRPEGLVAILDITTVVEHTAEMTKG